MTKPTYTEVQWKGIEAGQWAAEGVMEIAGRHADQGFTKAIRADLKVAKGDTKGWFDQILEEGGLERGDWKEFRDAFNDARRRVLSENDVDPAVLRKV